MVFNYTRIVILIVHTSGRPVRDYADWTELAVGYTDLIPFNPATTLVELKSTQQAPADGRGILYINCKLYTDVGVSSSGFAQVAYRSYVGSGIDSGRVLVNGGDQYDNCFDSNVLQRQLADLITVDMTSAHVFTINSVDQATLKCHDSRLHKWVELLKSGTVTGIRIWLSCGTPLCAAVSSEYRLRHKEGPNGKPNVTPSAENTNAGN